MLENYKFNKPSIKSDNLILRPFKNEDIDDLKEWTPNKEIYKYWGKNPGKYDLNPELLINKKERQSISFHLYIEKDNKVIGDIYIYLIKNNKKAKIAIRLNPNYHNQGIATEAVKTMVDWTFKHTELQTIWTDVHVNHIASIKVLNKCGFKKIKTINNGKMVSTVCDYYIYEKNK